MRVYPVTSFAGFSIKPLPKPIIILLMVGAAIYCTRSLPFIEVTFTNLSILGFPLS